MLHTKKIVTIVIIALIVSFGTFLWMNNKLNEVQAYQNMMYSEISSLEANMNHLISQIEIQNKPFIVNGITVEDSYLLKEPNQLKIKCVVDFSKLPANHSVGLELASTKNRLDQHYDPYSAEYPNKKWIELKGSNNAFNAELALDLDKNYLLSVVVNDGANQMKESIGYVAAKEWAHMPMDVSTKMRELGIFAPDNGYYKFDLRLEMARTGESYPASPRYSDFFDFANLALIEPSEIKGIRYSVSYLGEILNDFEVDPEQLKENPITIPGEVKFTCPVANNYSENDFEITVEIEMISGEMIKMTPYKRD